MSICVCVCAYTRARVHTQIQHSPAETLGSLAGIFCVGLVKYRFEEKIDITRGGDMD